MTKCGKIPGKHRQVCIGAMDRLISLKSRAIQTPIGASVDYSEEFTSIGTEWSDVVSLSRGPVFFDDTNVAKQATHIFKIRYRDDATAEVWVELDGQNYDVLNIEDLEERHEFLFLYSVKRGDAAIPINQV